MLTIDLETFPTDRALAVPYPRAERTPPANYKSEEAIEKWHENDREKWAADRVKRCSLNPREGRIVAYARKFDHASTQVEIAVHEGAEERVLRTLWEDVASDRLLCGFNSMSFDLPFALVRSAIVGVDVPIDPAPYLRRYSYRPHFDLRMALAFWDSRATGTLDEWLDAFDLPAKTGSGADVFGLVSGDEWDALVTYATDDVDLTYQLAVRVAPLFGIAGPF